MAWGLSTQVIDEMVDRLRGQFVQDGEFAELEDSLLALVLTKAVRDRFGDLDLMAGMMAVLLVREVRRLGPRDE